MKRTKTADPNIVVYPNGTHYFRRGSKEISLETKIYKEAVKRKRIVEAKGDLFLSVSLKTRYYDIVGEYIDSRKRELALGEIRTRTFQETCDVLEWYLMPYFGKKSVAKTTSMDWEIFRQTKLPKDLANIRKVFGHLNRWCIKQGYKRDLLILDIPSVERRQRRILKPYEIEAIWTHSAGSMRLFIALALTLGLRRTEIMTLAWSNIILDKRALLIHKNFSKTKRSRWVPLSDIAFALLTERLKEQANQSEWVFPSREKKGGRAHPDGLKGAWRTVLRKAFSVQKGEPLPDVQWHDLRATCEYYAHKRSDLSDTQLEKFFGSSIRVQRNIYVSMDADDLRGIEKSLSLQQVIAEETNVGKTGEKEK